jgi:inorganic triphosphatase YgiF
MQQEIEVKFLNVSHKNVREKLAKLGAKCTVPMRLMRRVVVDYPDKRLQKSGDSWMRIRDEDIANIPEIKFNLPVPDWFTTGGTP